jgi:putative hydrolase of the HAD superfamily
LTGSRFTLSSEICAIVLDAVGTLIHPYPPAPLIYAQAGKQFGSRYDAATIQIRFREAFHQEEEVDRRLGWRTSEGREIERWRHIVTQVLDDVSDPEACFRILFEHFRQPDAWHCDPSTREVLEKLAERSFVLAMASNYDSRLHSVVAGKPELTQIKHVIISSEVGWRKPARQFFGWVARSVGLSAEQILFVGDDRVNDVEGAEAAGMHAVWFDSKGSSESHGPNRINRLAELVS